MIDSTRSISQRVRTIVVFASVMVVATFAFAQGQPAANIIVMLKPAINIEVVNVEDAVASDSPLITVGPGEKLLALKVRVKNTGSETVNFSSHYLELKNADDEQFSALVWDVKTPSLKSGAVEPSDGVAGWITFKVSSKTSISTMRIRYTPIMGDTSRWMSIDIATLKDRVTKN
ncbi:MAG: DUF4352 domain-containing protein [Spirochaetia bacterium]|nr:DUF4352 domain-containing protein [Spirochaetia bacterium]